MPPVASTSPEPAVCLLIPTFGHDAPLLAQWPALRRLGLPGVVVDDGSAEPGALALRRCAQEPGNGMVLLRRDANGGKGAAMKDGLRLAARLGYSHALQVDADGQHDPSDLPALLAASRREPEAVVCALPRFGDDAPAARRWGRLLTRFWLAVNTLSLAIPDGLCGARVYPLARVLPLLDAAGDRMEFDPEILVRLAWSGVALRFVPVGVRYPAGGSSGFRLLEDNRRIAWMHCRLFFGMLARLPRLARRRPA